MIQSGSPDIATSELMQSSRAGSCERFTAGQISLAAAGSIARFVTTSASNVRLRDPPLHPPGFFQKDMPGLSKN